jgi:hypothetical protein
MSEIIGKGDLGKPSKVLTDMVSNFAVRLLSDSRAMEGNKHFAVYIYWSVESSSNGYSAIASSRD